MSRVGAALPAAALIARASRALVSHGHRALRAANLAAREFRADSSLARLTAVLSARASGADSAHPALTHCSRLARAPRSRFLVAAPRLSLPIRPALSSRVSGAARRSSRSADCPGRLVARAPLEAKGALGGLSDFCYLYLGTEP